MTNPSMFVIIEKLWITEDPDPLSDRRTVLLESNGECFDMHHDMGDPPSPSPAGEEAGEHPHLAFGLNFELFYELGWR